MAVKRLVLVKDVSVNTTIQRKSDLGPRATGARSRHFVLLGSRISQDVHLKESRYKSWCSRRSHLQILVFSSLNRT